MALDETVLGGSLNIVKIKNIYFRLFFPFKVSEKMSGFSNTPYKVRKWKPSWYIV
jgi:hypothetical protein